jgi:hypothetical protein
MTLKQRWVALSRNPAVRTALFITGIALMIGSPLVGVIPGPGGVFVFAAGLALTLKNSEWAKRQYVKFKRSHPNKGRWADWGMRRRSAQRREALTKERLAAGEGAGFGPDEGEEETPVLGLGGEPQATASSGPAEGEEALEPARR